MTVILLAVLLVASQAYAGEARSQAAKRHFAMTHPCPATGKPVPHCPGYVIDHIRPLCAGGGDAPDNMQWQTVTEAKAKDVIERRLCAKEKPCKPNA
jgi:hypothetical protein